MQCLLEQTRTQCCRAKHRHHSPGFITVRQSSEKRRYVLGGVDSDVTKDRSAFISRVQIHEDDLHRSRWWQYNPSERRRSLVQGHALECSHTQTWSAAHDNQVDSADSARSSHPSAVSLRWYNWQTLRHLVAEHNYQSGRHIYTGNGRPAVVFTLVM